MQPRLSLQQQIFFFKRLAFLLGAGMPLLESLSVLHEQATGTRQARLYENICGDIAEGKTFFRALGAYPRSFAPSSLSIVRVGEESGGLAQNLAYLAEELQQAQQLRRKIIGACLYPALIASATLGITLFLMLYLFPKITPLFISLHVQLPLTTRIVMALSVFLARWWLFGIGGIAILSALSIFLLRRSRSFHYFFDRMLLRTPLVGSLARAYSLAQASRTLGLLLKSGMSVSQALPITAAASRNLVYKRQFAMLARCVERGERISTQLERQSQAFPRIFFHTVAVGERSGSLCESLFYLADMYDREIEEYTKNLSTLIEPALMIAMGFVVGFIALAIITPLYGLTQNLHV